MSDYPFTLDKSSKKYLCPHCGRRTYVVYVDKCGKQLDPLCGRCDRQDHCGYHYPPRQLFADYPHLRERFLPSLPSRTQYGGGGFHPKKIPEFRVYTNDTTPESDTSSIVTEQNTVTDQSTVTDQNTVTEQSIVTDQSTVTDQSIGAEREYTEREYPVPSTLPKEVVEKTLARPLEENVLFVALRRLLYPYISERSLAETFAEYNVGTSQAPDMLGAPIFYQMDEFGTFRTGKMMSYDDTAHRNGKLKWIHRLLPGADTYHLQQCLFGAHLYLDTLIEMPDMQHRIEIVLVESEKTALILRALYRENGYLHLIPMACGGCEGFNPKEEHFSNPYHALQTLIGRKTELCPDEGKLDVWNTRTLHLPDSCCIFLDITMDAAHHTRAICPDYTLQKGDDIGDLILACVRSDIDPAALLHRR